VSLPPPLVRRYAQVGTGRLADSPLDLVSGFELDPGGVADLLAYGYLPGERTLLAGVTRVAPQWDLPPPLSPRASAPDARADQLWELLRSAVREAAWGCSRPRVPLSSGLDSRAIAAAAAAEGLTGLHAATFGDRGAADLPGAAHIARVLDIPHTEDHLPPDAALAHEERVWRATGGQGGPASAPGAATDALWAPRCDCLLSGTSGEVVWGAAGVPSPLPRSRLRKLGVRADPLDPREAAPPPPAWATDAGSDAWINLWTRQAGGSWNGVLSRLQYTAVAPIPWSADLLSYCLILDDDDRRDRWLLRHMLERHAPAVSTIRAVRGPVHDLGRAMRTVPAWRDALVRMASDDHRSTWRRLGIRPREVARLVRQHLAGRRDRTQLLSRLRVLWRWGRLLHA